MLIYWNWCVATWIFLVISISTVLSFQCGKKGKTDVKKPPGPASSTPNSAASKPPSGGPGPATPNPPAEGVAATADAADGHYEDVTVG